MSTETTATVTITLQLGADPIEGSFRQVDGATRPFHGWLELTSLLQAAAQTPHDTAAPNGVLGGDPP